MQAIEDQQTMPIPVIGQDYPIQAVFLGSPDSMWPELAAEPLIGLLSFLYINPGILSGLPIPLDGNVHDMRFQTYLERYIPTAFQSLICSPWMISYEQLQQYGILTTRLTRLLNGFSAITIQELLSKMQWALDESMYIRDTYQTVSAQLGRSSILPISTEPSVITMCYQHADAQLRGKPKAGVNGMYHGLHDGTHVITLFFPQLLNKDHNALYNPFRDAELKQAQKFAKWSSELVFAHEIGHQYHAQKNRYIYKREARPRSGQLTLEDIVAEGFAQWYEVQYAKEQREKAIQEGDTDRAASLTESIAYLRYEGIALEQVDAFDLPYYLGIRLMEQLADTFPGTNLPSYIPMVDLALCDQIVYGLPECTERLRTASLPTLYT